MARGAEGKAKRKEARKEERASEVDPIIGGDDNENDFDNSDIPFPQPVGASEIEVEGEEEEIVKKKSKRKKNKASTEAPPQQPVKKDGIKTAPLVLLILMTGTTLLPALLYAGDWFGAFIQKNHILGSLGHKLGVGPSPKKRVMSFYEKHDPTKIGEVDSILGKYYGDYPKLVKRLERKYGDYGYFIDWEKDEAPMTLAFDQLKDTRDKIQRQFDKHAPQQVKDVARNVRYNLTTLYTKGQKIWKKHIWATLQPYLGVPDAKTAAAQKRKDRKDAMEKKSGGRRKKNTDYRDDEEDH